MRQYHFIIKLLKTFKQKKDILDEMRKYISLVDEIVSDPAWAHEDRHRQLLLHHSKLFHPESGMPFLIDSLICANDQLAAYYDDNKNKIDVRNKIAQCGEYISNSYLKMMAVVGREQFLLNEVFKPTMKEIEERQGDVNAWANNLSHFGDLLDLIEADLKFADLLTHNLKAGGYLDFLNKPSYGEVRQNKAAVAENAVKCIENNDLVNARKWISAGRWREWLDREEYLLLLSLTEAIEQKNASELKKLLENKKLESIFSKEQRKFFENILTNFEKMQLKERAEEGALKAYLTKLQQLLARIESFIPKFPNFRKQLTELKSGIESMILDIKCALALLKDSTQARALAAQRRASSLFPFLWVELNRGMSSYEFVQRLQSSIGQRAEKLSLTLDKLSSIIVSRRKFLKVGTGAALAVVGGTTLLSGKYQSAQPATAPTISSVSFASVEIPDVGKIIYTEGNYGNAKYSVVIPHSSELDALNAARAAAEGPITWVQENGDRPMFTHPNNLRNLWIKTNERNIMIDANCAFSYSGMCASFNRLDASTFEDQSQVMQQQVTAAVEKFAAEIKKRIYHGKMILALHQNYREDFGIKSYRDDPHFSRYAEDVFINPEMDNDDFAYVNSRGWFEVLKVQGWNVVLQRNDKSVDDGSLSYKTTWMGLPYVNIEVQRGFVLPYVGIEVTESEHEKQADMIWTLNSLIDHFPQLATDMDFVPKLSDLKDWDNIVSHQDEINKLENDLIIKEANKNSGEIYMIIDKSSGFAYLYKGDTLITSYEVLTGEVKGDDQTVTVVRNGIEIWEEGNKQTGAGIYTVNKKGWYHGAPSFTLINERGIEVPNTFHRAPAGREIFFGDNNPKNSRKSNGCVNFQAKSLYDLASQSGFGKGVKVYILPDDPNNRFKIIDGELRFLSNQPNVNKTIKPCKPVPIILKAQGDNQYEELVLHTISNSKARLMDLYPTVSNEVYNNLAKIAYGIFGQESTFGKFGGIRGQLGGIRDSIGVMMNKNVSAGVFQTRITTINQRIKNDFNIQTTEDLLDIRKATIGAMSVLLDIYTSNISNTQKGNYMGLVPLCYNNPKGFRAAIEGKREIMSPYVINVLEYSKRVRVYVFSCFEK